MVLAGRGLSDPVLAREFMECSAPLPDPYLFADMHRAVSSVINAVKAGRKIVVHGDYDADGITATAVMVLGLRRLGAEVDWYLPSRFNEGYGLSRAAIETIVSAAAGLLITVDCGVNYPDEVAFATEQGLEVIVVDHHEPGAVLPECSLIHHSRGEYPTGDLCGVGLALKVLHALLVEQEAAQRDILPEELLGLLDLVAIGTVADLAPLRGENRFYVREGLRLLNRGHRVGLRALCEVSSCSGAVDSGTIAFRLAPRLNAAGRLSDPTPPLRLLLSEDEGEAKQLAGRLHEMNGERQDLERTMFDAAQRMVSSLDELPMVLVLADSDWHEGVVGIVASRLVEQYNRPTVLLRVRDGMAKGSGRSIAGYDLLSGISACGDLLSIYGGHAQAAGLTLQADKINALREALQKHASAALSEADLLPRYRADAVLTSEDTNPDTAQAIAMMEPFGSGNARPRFLLVDTVLRSLELTRTGSHLKGQAEVGGVRVSAIGFGLGRLLGEISGDTPCVVGAQLRADEWRGSVRTQLVLERVDPVLQEVQVACSAGARARRVHLGDMTDVRTVGREGNKQAAERGEPSRSPVWPASSRDRRDRPGRLTEFAQILGSGESALVLVGAAPRTLDRLCGCIPSVLLDDLETLCAGQVGDQDSLEGISDAKLLLVEWGAVCGIAPDRSHRSHTIVLDPPFRLSQLMAALGLGQKGTTMHLLYGEREREAMCSLLRYTVHPRFGMVCMYNALRSGSADEDALVKEASRIAWEQAKVVLRREDLRKALMILQDLGLLSDDDGKAKLDVRQSAVYREAEADYEECVRSCLTL